jgi:hypothetical protein
MMKKLLGILLLCVIGLTGCSSEKALEPEEVSEAMENYAKEGNLKAIWNQLPASYQDDVNGLVHDFGDKMDSEIWDKSFKVLQKVAKVLQEKKQFILAQDIPPGAIEKDKLPDALDALADAISTIANSEISQLSNVADLDTGDFIAGTLTDLTKHLLATAKEAAPELAGGPSGGDETKTTRKLLSNDGKTAVVEVTMEFPAIPNFPNSEPFVFKETLVQVEGKWIPEDVANGWKEKIAEAKQNLGEALGPETFEAQKGQVLITLGAADSALDTLLQANTQEEFDNALKGIKEMVPMGGMLPFGSGGGPPPGAFDAPEPDFNAPEPDFDAPSPDDEAE